MTRDAFERAKELDSEISAVEKLGDIIRTCCKHSPINDSQIEHNRQVEENDVTLCFLIRDNSRDLHKQCCTARLMGDEVYRVVNFMQSATIPINLYTNLWNEIGAYLEQLEDEFEELTGDYEREK